MRELDIREMALVSGGTVPVMVGGAVVGAVGYAGAVVGGQEFSWGELGLAVVSGAIAPAMVGGKVAAVVTAELLHAMNFAFAAGVLSGAISNQDEAGTNYGR
ncbi:hypothetical protein V0R50_11420 [Pseudomonas sp. 148P]|uniref:Uncharacterized protein n=1 Tax=Pseudomonas ulcerans TaxID=3115852 RepID=A0ABU7HQM4_9PSED|nr:MULTISPECIES: hypothetical protein [unclassified Pseudomonas]MEE1923772.1 hypothetical protein [Pseudomonas sp. 147P]MEE1933832.1 hypothetical protein [Pseudomonas sp. 148P]